MLTDPILLPFHGASLCTTMIEGKTYVAMPAICEHIGLDWEGQRQRLARDEALQTCTYVLKVRLPDDPRTREVTFLRADMLSGWLFGVKVNMVRPDLRNILLAYKVECYQVLDSYWHKGVAVNPRVFDIPDDEPWDRVREYRSLGQRFAEERARWEADTGRSLVGILGFSKPKLRAIEEHEAVVKKQDILEKMVYLGFDLRYILQGERTLTNAERAIRDAYRAGSAEDRAAIRRHAEAVRIKRSPEGWDRVDEPNPPGMYVGADTVRYLPIDE